MPAPKSLPMPKKLIFADEYLVDLSATNAAIRAGYSAKTAYSAGQRLLKDVVVAQAIEAGRQERSARTAITADAVLQELATAAFLDPACLYDERGALLPIHDMPEHGRRAVTSIETTELFEGTGESRHLIGYVRKVKFVSKEGTLNSVARHLGMFNDRLNLTADDGRVEALLAAQARAEQVRRERD